MRTLRKIFSDLVSVLITVAIAGCVAGIIATLVGICLLSEADWPKKIPALIALMVLTLIIHYCSRDHIHKHYSEIRDFFRNFHWREIRRRDLAGSAFAMAVIMVIEFLSPSLALTRVPKIPEFSADPINIHLGKEDITYSQIGSSAPWLQYLSKDRHQQFLSHLGNPKKRNKEEYASTPNAARRGEQSKVADKPERVAGIRRLSLLPKSEILERFRAKDRMRLIKPDAIFPRVQNAVPVYFREDVNTWSSINKHLIFNGNRKEDIFANLRESRSFWQMLVENTTRLARGFAIRLRPQASVARSITCGIFFDATRSDEIKPGRYCDLSVPVPVDYDLTAVPCRIHDEDFARDGNENGKKICVERWIAPRLVFRILPDLMIVYFRGALDSGYRPIRGQGWSHWNLEVGGKSYSLKNQTAIPLPDDLFRLKDAKLTHKPNLSFANTDDRVYQIWQNVDVQSPRSGQSVRTRGEGAKPVNEFVSTRTAVTITNQDIVDIVTFMELHETPRISMNHTADDISDKAGRKQGCKPDYRKMTMDIDELLVATHSKSLTMNRQCPGVFWNWMLFARDRLETDLQPLLVKDFGKLSRDRQCAAMSASLAILANFSQYFSDQWCRTGKADPGMCP